MKLWGRFLLASNATPTILQGHSPRTEEAMHLSILQMDTNSNSVSIYFLFLLVSASSNPLSSSSFMDQGVRFP
jgi:hypothetical protein